LKLVAMTGYGDVSTRARIDQAEFDGYLIKPVQLDALQRCLARLAAAPPLRINRR
jgi:CheY-like chemotaxis protein